MEPSTQKLIHTFGAFADLGQEVASAGDFSEMVRTSLHLLLGTLALRRGAVVELGEAGKFQSVAFWGLDEELLKALAMDHVDESELLNSQNGILISDTENSFIERNRDTLEREGIELAVPMIVRDKLTGFVLLGGKASRENFSADDFETIRAMVRHIGVGIHTHRLIDEVAQRA